MLRLNGGRGHGRRSSGAYQDIAENQDGKDDLIVVLGASDLQGAEISAETLTLGDPSFAGPLAGVPLGLPVYHILEPEISQYIPEEVYSENAGVMAMVIDSNEVGERFKKIREKANQA